MIIVAEQRLKALHKSALADLIAQGVSPGLTTIPPPPQKALKGRNLNSHCSAPSGLILCFAFVTQGSHPGL